MRATLTALTLTTLAAACTRTPTEPTPATATVAEPATRTPARSGDDKEYDTSVRPVYAATASVDPLVTRVCEALHGLPRKRRAACCSEQPGVVLTSECERNLGAAFASKALTLDPRAVAACETAMADAHAGCDWVGPWSPELPTACRGLVEGTLELGAKCRSSLECRDGLRCLGAGPTDPGVCGPPLAAGRMCSTAVDTLAVYARQDDFEKTHPSCRGYCERNRCLDSLPIGGKCSNNSECGTGNRCAEGKCVEGSFAPEGAACLGGDCAPGLRCTAGRCVAPKPLGAECSSDTECLAGCVIPDGATRGTCAMRCAGFPVIRKGSAPFVLPAAK
ncbi:hypothetical protein L6R52_02985 [Myxococcota bacterium]|nr:hypothetical protein [Myxococcota bacterium]